MGAPGCDDAPLISIPIGKTAKPVTMIYPYYNNHDFMKKQVRNWELNYPKELQQKLSVIVVDDGSPDYPANVAIKSARVLPWRFPLRVFRIEVDVRWNWIAARNIGANFAATGWMLLTDMDHVVTDETFRQLVYGQHDPSIIYRFSRMEHFGKIIHPHPNSWFMTRDMFWKIGGYDEACSGYYGTDGDYRRRCAATAPIRIMQTILVRHEYQGDSSTTKYLRKQPEDAAAKKIMRARSPGWKPKTLSFPFHEVSL